MAGPGAGITTSDPPVIPMPDEHVTTIRAMPRRGYPWRCEDCGDKASSTESIYLVNRKPLCFAHTLGELTFWMSAASLSADLKATEPDTDNQEGE